jgi:hypothetical protein
MDKLNLMAYFAKWNGNINAGVYMDMRFHRYAG